MQYKDYYKILGVDKNSTKAQIKSAYRKLAKKYHPDVDKSASAQDKFKDINEAYEVLSDPQKKERYDNLGSNWQAGQSYTPPPGFNGFNFNQNAGSGYSRTYTNFDDLGGFSDFFKSMFGDFMGGATSSRTSQRSSSFNNFGADSDAFSRKTSKQTSQKPQNLDMEQKVYLSVNDLMSEKPVNVRINTMEKCTQCSGVGSLCSNCNGTGFVNKSKILSVKIPIGIKEGQKIRLKDEGKTNEYGQKGNLYLNIYFKDSTYTINGSDLTKSIEITPSQAVMGYKKEIMTPHGKVSITIPPRTKTNKILRLKDLGLPKKPSGYGNLNIKIIIDLPDKLSEEQINLFKKLFELNK